MLLRFRVVLCLVWLLGAEETVRRPFVGVTHIHRTEASPRPVRMHIVAIDLDAPGLSFKLSGPGGSREAVRQTTRDFLAQEQAQVAVNAHFFLPYPSTEPDADLVGLAASNGVVYSGFETPAQSYAIVANAPALHIDRHNRAAIVHADPAGKRPREPVALWNAVSGSTQVITQGAVTIPAYAGDAVPGLLTPGGPGNYSNARSWYEIPNARTMIGLSRDRRTLFLFVVDRAAGSGGLTVTEAAGILLRHYHVHDALNLDGGGSTTLVMETASGEAELINVSSDNPQGRAVGSNLAVFARRTAQE